MVRHAGAAGRILEFGSGASTQVLAQSCPGDATIVSVETDPAWIERTRGNLARLGITRAVRFVPYKDWTRAIPDEQPFDLIFNDGVDKLRGRFAEETWPLLKVGGYLLFHDTRRPRDVKNALAIVGKFANEISSVTLNEAGSNITVVRRKPPEPWVDWNVVEGRERWEYGHAEPPEGLWAAKK